MLHEERTGSVVDFPGAESIGAEKMLATPALSCRRPIGRVVEPTKVSVRELYGTAGGISGSESPEFDVRQNDNMSDRHMKDSRITVRFPAELRRRLRDAARRSGTRESDLVRGAVERHLDSGGGAISAYDRAKRAGLIGVVRGASPDLSTNRKHFDGFGGS
jgi:hypothetical protein